MVEQSVEELRALLAADTWLTTGRVAKLFSTDRTTVHRWIKAGKIRYKETPGGQRKCDPADVRQLLAERETVRGGDAATAASETAPGREQSKPA